MSRLKLSFPLQMAIFTAVLGIAWIVLSDRLALWLFTDPAALTAFHTLKGVGFIVAASLTLYLLLRREARIRAQISQDYENTIQNAVVGIFQSTPEGRYISVNREMARIYGYDTPEQMVSEVQDIGSQLFVDPEERRALLEKIEIDGMIMNFESRRRRRDGQEIDTTETARAVRGASGKTLYYEGFIQDMTQREHAARVEDAMYEIAKEVNSTRSLGELYAFIHQTLAGILPAENFYIALYDRENNQVSFPYFVDQYDEPLPAKPFGRGLTEYVLRSEAPLLASPEVFRGLVARGEVEIVGVDSLDWLGVPLRIEERVIGVMAVQSYSEETRYGAADLSILSFISTQVALAIERKRAQTALQESEARYRSLVDNSPIGIMVQCDNRIVFVNASLCEKFNVKNPEQLLGRLITDFIHPDDAPAVLERVNRLLSGETPHYPAEVTYLQFDGSPLPTEAVGVRTTYQGRPAVQVMITDLRERRSAQQALQRQIREMGMLNAVSGACASATDLDDLFTRITQIIAKALYSDNCGVLLANPQDGVWRAHPSYHGADPGTVFVPHPLDEGVVGRVISTRRAVRVADIRAVPEFVATTSGVLAELAAPILIDGAVFGVINAESRQPEAFSEHDERLLTTVADSLATAIQKIQLLQHEKTSRRQAELLGEAALALSGPLDLKTRLNVILENLSLLAPFDAAAVVLEDLEEMLVAAARGFSPAQEVVGKRLDYTADWLELIEAQQPIIFADLQADPRFAGIPGAENARGWMSVPLVAYERAIGFINLESLQPNVYNEEQAALVQTFADQAAIAIENARLYEAEQQRRKDNARLLDELQVSTFELSLAYDKTLEGWARALEIRDRETSGHTRRVTELTIRLARRFGIPDEEIPNLRRGVLLHDIGKMGIPDHILKKTGPLTSEEWQEMRMHPQYAFDLLHPIAYLRPALDIPFCHHEKWDGSGYPRGLAGEDIPLAARIFAVVDVWDALLHERPYRKAWSLSETLAHIRRQSGLAFDPAVVTVFLEMVEEFS